MKNSAIEIKDNKLFILKELDLPENLDLLKHLPRLPILNFRYNIKITSLGLRILHEILKHFDKSVFYEDCTDSILNAMNLSPSFIPRDPEKSIISILVPWIDPDGSETTKALVPMDCLRLAAQEPIYYQGRPKNMVWLEASIEFMTNKLEEDSSNKDDTDLNISLRSLFHDIKANLHQSEEIIDSLSSDNIAFKRLMRRTRIMLAEIEKEKAKRNFSPGEFDIFEADLLADEFQVAFKAKEKALHYSGPAILGVKADARTLDRVLSCLLYNALSACKSTTWFNWRIESADLILTVEDDGAGLSAELQEKLFTLGATQGKAGGSGLGLYASRKFITEMGGTLEYIPNSLKTCFRIKLPGIIVKSDFGVPRIAVVSRFVEVKNHYKKILASDQNLKVDYIEPRQFHRNFPFNILISNERRAIKIAKSLGRPYVFANLSGSLSLLNDALKKLGSKIEMD